jgi:hypothetical protein
MRNQPFVERIELSTDRSTDERRAHPMVSIPWGQYNQDTMVLVQGQKDSGQ